MTEPGQASAALQQVRPGSIVCLSGDGLAGAELEVTTSGTPQQPITIIADDATIRNVVAVGVGGTSMPAFAHAAGGLLTDKQIDVIASGIRSWRHPQATDDPPPYATSLSGDITRGQAVYTTYCESCHGPKGTGGAKGSAITNDSVLALMSDQGLRTTIDQACKIATMVSRTLRDVYGAPHPAFLVYRRDGSVLVSRQYPACLFRQRPW